MPTALWGGGIEEWPPGALGNQFEAHLPLLGHPDQRDRADAWKQAVHDGTALIENQGGTHVARL
jgi:hypothetical protein